MTRSAARRLRTAFAALALVLASGPILPIGALAQEGAAAVQDVALTDVTFPLGATTVRIPKLVASGTRLSREDLAGIFRAGATESWATRLARLDASTLSAPVLVAEYAGPRDTRQTTTYREVVARDVRAGRIGELVAAGATLAIAAPGPAGNGAGTYGALRATDVDLTALARLAAEPGDGKGPPLQVYGNLQVSDVTFAYERGTTVKLAKFEGGEIGARPVPNGWNGAFDALTAGSESPEGRRTALTTSADLLGALAIGRVDMRGISVSDAASGPPVLTEVARVAYASAGPEAGLILEGLSTAGGAMRTRIGRVALTGSALAPFIAALRRMAQDPDGAPSVTEIRQLVAGLGTLTVSDVVSDVPADSPPTKRGAIETPVPKDAALGGKPVTRAKATDGRSFQARTGDPLVVAPAGTRRIALREAILGPGASGAGVPASARLTMTGLDIPASLAADMPLAAALPAYGYGDLSFDLAAEAAWDETERTVAVNEVTVSGRDIGRLRLAGLFGGIGPELFSGSLPAQTMLMFSGNARTLDLTVENGGLFERFLAAQSRDLSLKPDELRKEYVTASVLGVPVILGNGPAAKEIGAAMGQFVMNPGKLTIRAKAKEPTGVGFVELGTARSPAAVLDRLDVEAKAN